MTSRFLALCVLFAALLGPGSVVAAQTELPQDLLIATDLTPPQVQQIETFAKQWLPGLASDDPEQTRRARDHLLDPAKKRDASVKFRQEYSRVLLAGAQGADGLDKLSTGDRDRTVINALLLAAEIATSDSANLLLKRLADPRPAVRFAALSGLGRVFAAVQQSASSPAIAPGGVLQLVQRAGQQIEAEPSPRVLDAGVRALIEALKVTRESYEEVRQTAAITLFNKCAARAAAAKTLDSDEMTALLRAAVAARNALSENNPRLSLGLPGPNQQAPKESGVGAAGDLAGHLLAYAIRYRGDFPQDAAGREDGATLVQVCEAIVSLAVPKLGGTYSDSRMAEDFRQTDAARTEAFVRKAREAIRILQGLGLGPFPL